MVVDAGGRTPGAGARSSCGALFLESNVQLASNSQGASAKEAKEHACILQLDFEPALWYLRRELLTPIHLKGECHGDNRREQG